MIEIIKEKKQIFISAGKGFLALASISTVHYAGFLYGIPFKVISVAAIDFLPNFISVFCLYVAFCYSIAKVFSFIISQLYSSALLIFGAVLIRSKKYISPIRAFKAYKETATAEKAIYILSIITIFLALFTFSYIDPEKIKVTNALWYSALAISSAAILKLEVLVRSPRAIIARLKNKRKVKHRSKVASGLIYSVIGALLCLAFYTGTLRLEYLENSETDHYKSATYEGYAKVLLSSGGSILAVDNSTRPVTYIYLTKEFIIKITDTPSSEKNNQQNVTDHN